MRLVVAFVLISAAVCSAETLFKDEFNYASEADFLKAWTLSSWKDKASTGKWELTAGRWSGDEEDQQGMQTASDMKFHAISAKLPKSFSNRDKDLVVQFTAKTETREYSFCSGGYIKLFSSEVDLSKFGGDSPYYIMFGPDQCSYDVSKIHLIFNFDGQNLQRTQEIKLDYADKNEFTHLYTLVLKPDNTYRVLFDGKEKASGNVLDDWDFPKKTIDDPTDKKPADWVDEAKIPDANDVKPEGWDDVPETIPDPEATKPDDWDEEEDGEWEPPSIPNPEYKGEWKPKMIDNPAYKGVWKARQIDNENFVAHPTVYDDIAGVGFELWVVNNGTVFDNILVTNNFAEAERHSDAHWKPHVDGEKDAKKTWDDAKKAAEEAAKKAEEPADEDDEDDHDEL